MPRLQFQDELNRIAPHVPTPDSGNENNNNFESTTAIAEIIANNTEGVAPENYLDLGKGDSAVQQDDYSVICTIHGMEIHLRDMSLGDLEAMQRYEEANITSQMRLISRICTKWGEKPGITLEQLRKERPLYFMKVSRATEYFFLDK